MITSCSHPTGKLDELINRVRTRLRARGLHAPVSTSFLGGEVMQSKELRGMDYVNLHVAAVWRSPRLVSSGTWRLNQLVCLASTPSA